MRKKDILASFIIGEVSALIFLGIFRFLEFPELVLKLANFLPLVLPLLVILATYIAQILSKKIPVLFQAARSFLVGILNTSIDFGILNLLMGIFGKAAGWQYSFFKGFSFFCATINSYFWNKFWAFEKKEMEEAGKEFLQFCLIAGIGFLIHLGIATLLVNVIGPQFGLSEKIWANVGALIAVFFGFSWNFLGYKFIVFKK